MNLYWESKHKLKLIATVQPFESVGTATSPGNGFCMTPIYDKSHAMARWTVTADEPVLYYDPVDEGIEVLKDEDQKRYDFQKLNYVYGREYQAKAGKPWLGQFPRPMGMHNMWKAQYFGQIHTVKTKQSHFNSLPDESAELWKRLDYEDYDAIAGNEESQDQTNNLTKDYGGHVALEGHRQTGYLELKLKAISVSPRVFEIKNFLSRVEVDHILAMAKYYNSTMEESLVHPGGGKLNEPKKKGSGQKDKESRSSTSTWLHRGSSPILDAVYRRAADVLQIDESLLRHRNEYEKSDLSTHHSIAEALQLVRYTKGQTYTPHHDFLYPSITNRYQPSRYATLILYLNEGMQGGETTFPRAVNLENQYGIKVTPKVGKAVLFYNVLPDGNFDDLSQHSGSVVDDGEKWIANMWIWDPILD